MRRWFGASLLAIALALSPSTADAHPLGNFTINHYLGVVVRPDVVVLDYVVDMAEIPAFQERPAIEGLWKIYLFPYHQFWFIYAVFLIFLVVGLLVAAGWFASGYLGADDFNPTPVVSLTFIAPIADSLQYAMLSTGSTLNFGIATVGGVFIGSLVTALATGRFHLEGYQSPRHMLRSAGGAALMGAGGVMAFGCSVGQGLTGFSTLALASFVTVAGIMAGTALGLRGALRVRPLAAA